MRKKKLEEINPRESDIYVECSLHINERGVPEAVSNKYSEYI